MTSQGKAASTSARKRILGKSGLNKWKWAHAGNPAAQLPKQLACPECGSQRFYNDGFRYVRGQQKPVQRLLCRDCGHRFSRSEAPRRKKNVTRQVLNSSVAYRSTRRVCVSQTKAMVNLAAVETQTRQEKAAGATLKPPMDQKILKGILAQFMAYLENEGYAEDHDYDHAYVRITRLLAKRGANFLDPESVKSVIAKQPWKDGVKRLAVYAYDALTKVLKIEWTAPEYKQEETLPFIPEEKELDALILGSRSRRMTAFLQTLKETFADPGEAIKLRWIDLDSENNTITINHPVRGHNPRQLKISNKLVSLLNMLPKTSERIFPTKYVNLDGCFRQLKRRVAHNLQNPRILSISFTTFRHWGATMTYHYTRNILLVKELLGHKRIENTMKYTRLVKFKDDDFDVETATTVEQAKELLKVGFDYITERDGIMLFRRPKRFGSLWGYKCQLRSNSY